MTNIRVETVSFASDSLNNTGIVVFFCKMITCMQWKEGDIVLATFNKLLGVVIATK